MTNARKVGDFYQVDGFIVYRNIVVDCPITHEPDLSREELYETEVEAQAKQYVADHIRDNPEDASTVYYESGRILV